MRRDSQDRSGARGGFALRAWVRALVTTTLGVFSMVVLGGCAYDQALGPSGELRFSPYAPLPGARVTVTYLPGTTLAGERELVLRAHFRTLEDDLYNGGLRNHRIATLNRQSNGNFTAEFTLPDSAVYAAFVIEDAVGQRLDADGGKLFEILVHGADGQPLYHALIQRAYDFGGRYWMTSHESVRRAMELYPDSLRGWGLLRFYERVALGSSGGDSLLTWHRENFAGIHSRYSDQSSLRPETIAAIQDYAQSVADSAVVEFWTDRMLNEAPGTYVTEQKRAMSTYSEWYEDKNAEALSAFEEYWPAARGKGTQIAEFALTVSIESRDLAAVDRWTERMIDDDRRGKFFVANRLARLPERRERALALALEAIPPIRPLDVSEEDLVAAEGRTLGSTVREYARFSARARAWSLNSYSRVLESAGRLDAALEAMEEAASESVDPDVFRRLAEVRLAQGDSAGAAEDYAVVAADPGTSRSEADSLAVLAGLLPDSPQWRRLLDSARDRIHPRVLADTVGWTPPPSLVSDAEGNRRLLSELLAGRPAVLVFWTRNCNYSVQEIPEIVRLNELVEPKGVQILSIAIEDLPGPEMAEFIETIGVTYPVYYDLEREASNAFSISGTPTHLVVDAEGKVRFEYSELSEIPLQLEALERMRDPPA